MRKLLIFIVILAAVFAVFWNKLSAPSQNREYTANTMPLSFQIPAGYIVQERNGAIIIMLEEDYQSVINGEREGGEGPPVITIQSFSNLSGLSPQAWAEQNVQLSNYNLKMGEVSATTVAGNQAIAYEADGLYASRNVVFTDDTRIYHASGQFLDRDSALYRDFEPLVDSIKIE